MNYKKYEFKGQVYNLKPAFELIKKGKWNEGVAFIQRKTGAFREEAEQIGNELAEQWQQKQKAGKETRRMTSIALIAGVLLLLGVGYLVYHEYFGQYYEEYVIEEKDPDLKSFRVSGPDLGYTIDTWWEDSDEVTQQDMKRLYDDMESTDAQYFIYNDSGKYNGVYAVSEDRFDKYVENKCFKFEALDGKMRSYIVTNAKDSVSKIGRQLWNYLNGWDLAQIEDKQIIDYTYGGEPPKEYYESRELKTKCTDLKARKICVYQKNYMAVIYSTKITTEQCKGKSIFPKKGKTKKMKVMVLAGFPEFGGLVEMHAMLFQ